MKCSFALIQVNTNADEKSIEKIAASKEMAKKC